MELNKMCAITIFLLLSAIAGVNGEETAPVDTGNTAEVRDSVKEVSGFAGAVDTRKLSKDELEELEDRREDSLEAYEDSLEDAREDSIEAAEEMLDTVDASELALKISNGIGAFTRYVSKSRAQGYGGGVVIQPLLMGLKMKPVYELAHNDRILKTWTFPELTEGYEPVLATGALVYGGVGRGLRVGVGGWGAETFFGSREEKSDSLMVLKVATLYGGLLLEKVFLRNNLNIFAGGMLGGGKIKVDRGYQSSDAFKTVWDLEEGKTERAEAVIAGLEIHSGLTVTVLPWMHIGGDLNGLVMFSVNGFGTGNGFITANPGVRLRITLGNLG
ncbi:MAG: hypothetical protein GX556_17585 [Fibrobacter sp.]|nr:hypothetical protein [Fibrobacter sp.]